MKKLTAASHTTPFTGPFAVTRVHPGHIIAPHTTAFGPLAIIDHAIMKKGLTIKMHEHQNDEIISYVLHGTVQHRDSANITATISATNLMMMNAGSSFWHEEKVLEEVEMLQIFIRPHTSNLAPDIQFHTKHTHNNDWRILAGPEKSDAPIKIRQNVYVLDAHLLAGNTLAVPYYDGLTPFLYVMRGQVTLANEILSAYEAATANVLLPITATVASTVVLFFIDLQAPASLDGTISGAL